MKEKVFIRILSRKVPSIVLGVIVGFILLSVLSYFQKRIINAPLTLKGFSVPFFYGGTIGGIVTYFIYRLLQSFKKIKNSELKYRSIFESSFDGYLYFDHNFNILNCNQSLLKMLGFTSQELRRKTLTDLTPKNWQKVDHDFFLSLCDKENSGLYEKELLNKEGRRIPVELCVHRLSLDKEKYYWAVIHDITDKKTAEQKIFETMLSAEEKERGRYAKELHDGLGPILSTAMIYLNTAEKEQDIQELKSYSKRAYDLMEEAVISIKEISNNLSPEILKKYGLVQAIHSFIEKCRKVKNIEFIIHSNLDCRLPAHIEFTVYRTLIELLNNSVKYSDADKIILDIKKADDRLVIIFTDDGKGFDYEKIKNMKKGFGLLNLEARINKIGGAYEYNSQPGEGIQVKIIIQPDCLDKNSNSRGPSHCSGRTEADH